MESEPYQQLMEACRTQDLSTQDQIVKARLHATAGPEKAFWLRIRASQRARAPLLPQVLESALVDLDEALRLAPQDPENQARTVTNALGLCVRTEQLERLPAILRQIRQKPPVLATLPMFWLNLGSLHLKKRKWHQGARAFARGIAAFEASPHVYRHHFQCRLALFYALYGSSLAGCGRAAEAESAVAQALNLACPLRPEVLDHVVLGLAQGELALQRGDVQAARVLLQQGIVRNNANRRRNDPSRQAETELFAARLARAEGNAEGFHYFCSRAQVICTQYNLSFSAAAVEAVLAGADR